MDTETAAVVIQYHYRKWFYRNAECCICYEKVRHPCFIYKTSGVCIFYNYIPLLNYFNTSGKFIDPKTRNEYTTSEIKRFKCGLGRYFPNKKLRKKTDPARSRYSSETRRLHFNHPLQELLYTFSNPERQPVGTVNMSSGRDGAVLRLIEIIQPNGTVNMSSGRDGAVLPIQIIQPNEVLTWNVN
jgi:hypothetical protein